MSDWGSDLLPILHAHEITLLMDFVVASAIVGSSKPHRDIFLYALGRAGVRAEETVYVGDSYLADVLGRVARGCTRSSSTANAARPRRWMRR